MTWIVGSPCPFGYSAGFADIRVRLADGTEKDCLRKVYQVGSFIGAAFAGSVRIGFSMLYRLTQLLPNDDPTMAWDLSSVAGWWPSDAREIWSASPDNERAKTCELVLFGVDPSEGTPWSKPYVYIFRSPCFAAEPASRPLDACSIGKGSKIKTYCDPLRNLCEDDDLIKLETLYPGGIATGILDQMTDRLLALPIPGISPHLHACLVFRDHVDMKTNDRRYISGTPSPDLIMPTVANNYTEFLRMCGGSSAAVECAVA